VPNIPRRTGSFVSDGSDPRCHFLAATRDRRLGDLGQHEQCHVARQLTGPASRDTDGRAEPCDRIAPAVPSRPHPKSASLGQHRGSERAERCQ